MERLRNQELKKFPDCSWEALTNANVGKLMAYRENLDLLQEAAEAILEQEK